MKKTIIINTSAILLLAFVLGLYLLNGCQKNVEDIFFKEDYPISYIINSLTGDTIDGAKIYIDNEELRIYSNGTFQFPLNETGEKEVTIKADGYVTNYFKVAVNSDYTIIPEFLLKPISQQSQINEDGGVIIETLSDNRAVILTIPKNTVTTNVNFSITYIDGLDIGFHPVEHLPIAVIDISTDNEVALNNDIIVDFDLPFEFPIESELSIMKFDEETFLYEDITTKAKVTDTGLTAMFSTQNTGRFSVVLKDISIEKQIENDITTYISETTSSLENYSYDIFHPSSSSLLLIKENDNNISPTYIKALISYFDNFRYEYDSHYTVFLNAFYLNDLKSVNSINDATDCTDRVEVGIPDCASDEYYKKHNTVHTELCRYTEWDVIWSTTWGGIPVPIPWKVEKTKNINVSRTWFTCHKGGA